MSNKRKLLRLTESLYSSPHLISQDGFSAISHYLDARNMGVLLMADDETDYVEPRPDAVGTVGILNIHGALTYKPVMGMCGELGTSYTNLLNGAVDLIDQGCKIIVLDCDSGGGQGYGAFETANRLREMCDDGGVRLIAYNDGVCASACYALACAADEVISNPAAETGSIGVLIALMNNSKALEMNGYARTFISAGDSKIPFDANGDWKPDFLADLQTKVDAMYAEFVSHVATHTGMSEQEVKGTQAKMFMASDALKLGLINKVMTRSEFIDYIATESKDGTQKDAT